MDSTELDGLIGSRVRVHRDTRIWIGTLVSHGRDPIRGRWVRILDDVPSRIADAPPSNETIEIAERESVGLSIAPVIEGEGVFMREDTPLTS